MVSRRPRLRASVPALVLAWIIALGAPGTAGAASPARAPGCSGRSGRRPHRALGVAREHGRHRPGPGREPPLGQRHQRPAHRWIDLRAQRDIQVLRYGASYASASADRRGHGSLTVSPDGNSATVSWHDENPKGNENGTFQIMRVTSPIGGPGSAGDPGADPGGEPGGEPGPEPGDEALPDIQAQVTGMTTGAMAAVTEVLLAAIEQAIAAGEAALEDAETALESNSGARSIRMRSPRPSACARSPMA